MPNNHVFNYPLKDPLGAVEPSYTAAQSGDYYVITTGNQSVVQANGFLALQLTVPANSRKKIRFDNIQASSSSDTILSLYRNATLNVSGTSATPRNTNWAYPDASVVTGSWVSQTANPTSGGTFSSD
ncbi:hypothetical protein [Paenibacillus dokdonensis]|uniref:hypothetical protein n=1 Tax=Paenibacillus dokdonensis TaxID=2567944 RepID=UPI0010A7E3F4|nr:hypothetical protein [Paenibacillus dokdonensis]